MSLNTLYDDLKSEIATGRVVVIVGTGVSITASGDKQVDGHAVARWDGLLLHGVDHCLTAHGLLTPKEAESLRGLIDLREVDFLINAAEIVSGRLLARSRGVYHRWLKDTVGNLDPVQPEILQVLASLPGVLATLNYDGLFELGTGRVPITWQDHDKVESVLRGTLTNAVLHLHGYYDQPDSVVLGLRSYDKVAGDSHASAVTRLFTLDHTLLFVGCGGTLKDPNFSRLVEWGSEALRASTHRHFLLCSEEELETVRGDLKEAPWLHPLVYGKGFDKLVPFLRGLVPAPGTVPRPTPLRAIGPGFDLDGYRQAMRKFYGRLKLEDLDPTSHDIRPLALTGMFIPQNARECAEFLPRAFELPKELQQRLRESGEWEDSALDEETLQQYRRAYLEQLPRPILDVVQDPARYRLVILGDPGSGKSTLLQYLLLRWAEQPPADGQDGSLPLLIELREYARLSHSGEVSGVLDFLDAGESVRHHLDRSRLDGWLKSNASLVLFDGLDEVFDPAERKAVSTAIHRFADQYPEARVIVTSRVIGYRHESWRDEGFRQFMLQDLDEAQVRDFLTRWHRDAYADRTDGEVKRARLARAIQDSAAIRQLAGNPLLLTMMAILNRTQDLPRDRAELYEQCARLLLHQWKIDLGSDPEVVKATLDYKDKRNLLLRVAGVMYESEGGLAANLLEEAQLERTLAQGLEGIPGVRAARAARALIDQLRGRNFMLCWLGGRSFAFVHRTFLEYFCALEIRLRFEQEQTLSLEQLKSEIYGRHWRDENWREVLCLLAGMIAPRFVAEVLLYLLEQPDPKHACANIFLAARCVREVRKRAELGPGESNVRDRIRRLAAFDAPNKLLVFDIRTRAVASYADTWRDHPETLPWLKSLAQSNEYMHVRQAAVEALGWGWTDDPETLPWLKSFAESDGNWAARRIAARVVAQGWHNDPATLPWLKSLAHSDENVGGRWAVVEVLAQGWREDPDTLPILKFHARSDKHLDVRRAALAAVARGWPKRPDILSWLKSLIKTTKYENVRREAVQTVARGWPKRPDILSWLKSLIKTTKYENVRREAVQTVARGWPEQSDTLSWLKSRAQSDKHWDVGQAAVEAVARGWLNDPATLPWLKSLVQSDEHEDVRRAAVEAVARGWPDDPETLPWLESRAHSDEHWHVRVAVEEALARLSRNDVGAPSV